MIAPLLLACASGTAEPGDTATSEHPSLSLGEHLACDDPGSLAFDEVGASWGLTGDPGADHGNGGSAVVDDLDGDGRLDVLLAFHGRAVMRFTRTDEGFAADTLPFLAAPEGFATADVDADGDLDVIAGTYGGQPEVAERVDDGFQALQGFPSFERDEAQLRLLAPGDLDGDGVLDLYGVVNGASGSDLRDVVFRGLGGGAFELLEQAVPAGLADRHGFDALVFDLEGDGDQEVYVVNDLATGNNLLAWADGALAEAPCSCAIVQDGMSVDLGDFDRDGRPDLYLAASKQCALQSAQADGGFVDVAVATGANPLEDERHMAWGAVWLDLDNDGALDVAVARGDLWAADDDELQFPRYDLPPAVLRQQDGHFSDVAAELGLTDTGSFRAVVAADHNEDGVLDPLFVRIDEPPLLYLSTGCTEARWIEVAAPQGSRVEVDGASGTWTAWVTGASGSGSARPHSVHIGLGAEDEVDVRVTLPDGSAVGREGVSVPRRLTVTP